MTLLAANHPHETDLGFVDVDNPLPPGRYRFRLTVFDEARNESEPAFIVLTVNEVQREPSPNRRTDPVAIDPAVVIDRGAFDRRRIEPVITPGIGEAIRTIGPISPLREAVRTIGPIGPGFTRRPKG